MNKHFTRIITLLAMTFLLASCKSATSTAITETFDSAEHWITDVDAVAEVGVVDGAMLIHVFEPGQIAWTAHDIDYGNLTVTVTTRVLDGPLDNEYGVLLHMQDEQSFLAFSLSADGYARAARYQDMVWQVIGADWTQVDAINQGLEENHLNVTATNGHYSFSINDQMVLEIEDMTFTKGTIGLYAGAFSAGGVQVSFDNLEVQPGE